MDFINNLLVPLSWPAKGLWENIIKWFAGVGNFGVAIILLTLCLKLLLLPLDFWNKSVSRKMTANNALMQPELEEIKKFNYSKRQDEKKFYDECLKIIKLEELNFESNMLTEKIDSAEDNSERQNYLEQYKNIQEKIHRVKIGG